MATTISGDDSDGNLESFLIPRGASGRIDSIALGRSNGHPFKRNPAAGRPFSIASDIVHGSAKDESSVDVQKGSGQLPIRNTRSMLTSRNTKTDGESGSTKGKSCICSILISVVVCCFLAEALLQGSIMLLWRQSDFPLNIAYHTTPSMIASSDRNLAEYTLRFEPLKFKERALQEKQTLLQTRMTQQNYLRSPYIAFVCKDLHFTPEALYLITLAKGLQSLGYKIQLFTSVGGPMQRIWKEQGVIVEWRHFDQDEWLLIDWSKFDGVILCSLDSKQAFRSFLQEPFRNIVVIWIILEDTLGKRLRLYESSGLSDLLSEWMQAFARADVVIFPDYTLAMMHTLLDTGNFLVISGSPKDVWDVKSYMKLHSRTELRETLGFKSGDVVLTIVGSPFTYQGVWREHAMVMKAVVPILKKINEGNKEDHVAVKVLIGGNYPAKNYSHVVQVIAKHLGLKGEDVLYFGADSADLNKLLWMADVVIYSSLRDEQAFPSVLVKAIAFERFVLVPNLTVIRNVLTDGSGNLFYPVGDVNELTEKIILSITRCKLMGQAVTKILSEITQILVRKVLEGYGDILETILPKPSDAMLPNSITETAGTLVKDWMWEIFPDIHELQSESIQLNDHSSIVFMLENLQNNTSNATELLEPEVSDYDTVSQDAWNEERLASLADDLERQEEEQIEERHELLLGSWENVYKVVKKMDRLKNELHEQDDGELERISKPLCIYEPYFGIGASVFLHQNDPLYRGISMISKQRRLEYDDVDAAVRLPLLNQSYYQNVLCEYGAFFAIANKIDNLHKNSWIGFQSWKATSRKVKLSMAAERSLQDAMKIAQHGDAFYFWAEIRNDDNFGDRRGIHEDFWSFCDIINNNNCRSVYIHAFKRMYGLPESWISLPPMPVDGGKWSSLHSWAMSTSSYQEFVMFARMLVDALDAEHYVEHHDHNQCPLGTSVLEGKHCYCRLLELLVNVWAYHSARPMIYVDPKTGYMHEEHSLEGRQNSMWLKYFDYDTLKGMDEDLAEEVDDELQSNISKRRLWPQTGEVFWQGMYERERQERYAARMEKKKKNKERLERIRNRLKYKPLSNG